MKRNRITDADLLKAVKKIEDGLVDAELGGGLVKQRIARPNQGKSSGFRTILAFHSSDRTIFIYGFAKKDRDNICSDELQALKDLAAELLSYNDKQLNLAIKHGALFEVKEVDSESDKGRAK